jgi:hypothetical protein
LGRVAGTYDAGDRVRCAARCSGGGGAELNEPWPYWLGRREVRGDGVDAK